MTTNQIQDYLNVLMTEAGVDPALVNNEAHFGRDLGLDSLDVIGLLLEIERCFAIRIPDEDWWQLNTVGQLVSYICRDQPASECSPMSVSPSDEKPVLLTNHYPF